MHTMKQLIYKLDQMNLDYYEVESDINDDISIQLTDFDQLCLFIKKHNIDTVFYRFEYVSAEDLQITDKILDDLHIDNEIIDVMQKDFNPDIIIGSVVSDNPATPEEKPHLRTGWGRQRGLWVSPRMGRRLQLDTWLSLACILFHEWIEHSCTKVYYH